MAMACDQTRVFFDAFSQPVNNMLFLDVESGHHQLTHDEPDPQPEHRRIVQFTMGELAYLIARMASVREGAETLLDHAALLATTDCSNGRTHDITDYPLLIAGRANGALRTGVHYQSFNENASKVMLTLMRAMGLRDESYGFGDARTTESLGAIER
jgi:hypothetical protein